MDCGGRGSTVRGLEAEMQGAKLWADIVPGMREQGPDAVSGPARGLVQQAAGGAHCAEADGSADGPDWAAGGRGRTLGN